MRQTKSLEATSCKVDTKAMSVFDFLFSIHCQKVTLKLVSQAGHSICRSPGRRFIRNCRSQPGQEISTRATVGTSVKWHEQVAHFKWAGRLLTPTTSTFPQSGQPIFSSAHFFRVIGWSIRTLAWHNVHRTSPSSFGSKPSHLGHESGGGATRDSTVNSSPMVSAPVLSS